MPVLGTTGRVGSAGPSHVAALRASSSLPYGHPSGVNASTGVPNYYGTLGGAGYNGGRAMDASTGPTATGLPPECYVTKPTQSTALFPLEHALGAEGVLAVHPLRGYVAYAAGTVVVLWDWRADRRVFLQGHTASVTGIAFTPDGQYIVTADQGRSSTMIVWDLAQYKELYRATMRNDTQVASLHFSSDSRFLLVTEAGNLARVSVWDWSHGFTLIAWMPLQNTRSCGGATFAPESAHFVTVESSELKFWQLHPDVCRMTLCTKRAADINLHSDFVAARYSYSTGLLFVLCRMGKLIVLDRLGKWVNSVERTNTEFCALGVSTNHVFVGTKRGSVLIFNATTLEFERDVPYQHQLRQRMEVGAPLPTGVALSSTSKGTFYAEVTSIDPTLDGCYAAVRYSDHSIHILDLMGFQVVNFCTSHFDKVMDVAADPMNPNVFASVSHDQTLSLWTGVNEQLLMNIIDIPNTVDPTMSYMPFLPNSSNLADAARFGRSMASMLHAPPQPTTAINMTSVVFHPKGQTVACGDETGIVRIFETHTAHLIALIDSSDTPVVSMDYSRSGQYLGVCHRDGFVAMYDTWSGHKKVCVLEPKSPQQWYGRPPYRGVHILRGESSTWGGGDEARGIYVLTATSPRTITLSCITSEAGHFRRTTVNQFIIDANCAGMAVHPSEEYLLVSSQRGNIFLYHMRTAVLRGVIPTLPSVYGCEVDPAGLYVAVSTQSESDSSVVTQTGGNVPLSRVALYEIGTGRYVGHISNLPNIRSFKFSPDGHKLTVGCDDGVLMVWKVVEGVRRNIQDVVEAMKVNKDFWLQYPIYLSTPATMAQAGYAPSAPGLPLQGVTAGSANDPDAGMFGGLLSGPSRSFRMMRESQPTSDRPLEGVLPSRIETQKNPQPMMHLSAPVVPGTQNNLMNGSYNTPNAGMAYAPTYPPAANHPVAQQQQPEAHEDPLTIYNRQDLRQNFEQMGIRHPQQEEMMNRAESRKYTKEWPAAPQPQATSQDMRHMQQPPMPPQDPYHSGPQAHRAQDPYQHQGRHLREQDQHADMNGAMRNSQQAHPQYPAETPTRDRDGRRSQQTFEDQFQLEEAVPDRAVPDAAPRQEQDQAPPTKQSTVLAAGAPPRTNEDRPAFDPRQHVTFGPGPNSPSKRDVLNEEALYGAGADDWASRGAPAGQPRAPHEGGYDEYFAERRNDPYFDPNERMRQDQYDRQQHAARRDQAAAHQEQNEAVDRGALSPSVRRPDLNPHRDVGGRPWSMDRPPAPASEDAGVELGWQNPGSVSPARKGVARAGPRKQVLDEPPRSTTLPGLGPPSDQPPQSPPKIPRSVLPPVDGASGNVPATLPSHPAAEEGAKSPTSGGLEMMKMVEVADTMLGIDDMEKRLQERQEMRSMLDMMMSAIDPGGSEEEILGRYRAESSKQAEAAEAARKKKEEDKARREAMNKASPAEGSAEAEEGTNDEKAPADATNATEADATKTEEGADKEKASSNDGREGDPPKEAEAPAVDPPA